MESNNRNVWIIVAAVLVVACCCALALATAAASWIAARASDVEHIDIGGLRREETEETFSAAGIEALEVDLFAGTVIVHPGEGDRVRIVAVKKAPSRGGLDRIDVKVSRQDDRLAIKTKKRGSLSNSSVDLTITVPASIDLDLDTGAGTVDVRGVDGRIDVATGAGTVQARDVSGTMRVGLGAVQIMYEGSPAGSCRFNTGVGNISLKLPADADVQVDVGTGLGYVTVGFDLDGRVKMREAEGVIGDGSQGSINAHTGAGNVTLDRQ